MPRVGAQLTFPAPVIFTWGFNAWRILPSTQVVGAPSGTQPQFTDTRTGNTAPQNVGGDVKLATFNVLNFFPTTGNEYVSSGLGSCTYFTDRQGNQITNNSCNPNGPRGAANAANLARQRDKIVAAINGSGADVVSLEELENSVQFGKNRDFAINALVNALNTVAGAGTWAAVPSPSAAELPAARRPGRHPRRLHLQAGQHRARRHLRRARGASPPAPQAFADAREPLAQAFKRVGTPDSKAFGVIVNHFKSKGSGTADPNGQGNANDRRVLQANSLVNFADQFKTARGITRVFLAGDFNAYTEEDPIQVLTAAGYTQLESSSDPERGELQLRRPGRLARPRARQLRGPRGRRGRRHLDDQRLRVGLLRVQPVQLQRHQPVPARPVPVLRPQPRDRRHQRPGRGAAHPDRDR